MRMIGMPKNFIGARPGRVYSWGGSASVQTSSGTVVTFPQAAERPLSGLNVYGHSTQSGTPSPENPVPIVSAGDEGEINVSVSDGGTQSQTLTLSTPGGLPGIPVSSGGNYTDESGQQWVCDEIDLKRGKYVQRVQRYDADQLTWKRDFFGDKNRYSTPVGMNIGIANRTNSYSNRFLWKYSGASAGNFDTSEARIRVFFSEKFEDISALMEWFNSNPTYFICELATPIETDLTAEEIAAYKALHTYSPTTTVSNDANAWMKVEYKG